MESFKGVGEETENTTKGRSAEEQNGGLSGLQETFCGSVRV